MAIVVIATIATHEDGSGGLDVDVQVEDVARVVLALDRGEPLAYNAFSLLGGNKVLAGSMIGGIAETQEMLDFCAKHGIGAEIETIPADKVNEAYERVENSDVRYRFVIDAKTIGA